MTLIARLIEAGTPADLIEEVALLVAEKRALDQRRKHERERKRKSRDVTGGHGTSGDTPEQKGPHTPKKDIPPVTPKGVTAPQGAKRRGSRIPDDWVPPPVADLGPKFQALAAQWTSGSYQTEAAAFQAYWQAETGAKASKSNWKRAWENRVAQIHSKVMRDQKFGNAPPDQSDPSKPKTPQEWLAYCEDRVRSARRAKNTEMIAHWEEAERIARSKLPKLQVVG